MAYLFGCEGFFLLGKVETKEKKTKQSKTKQKEKENNQTKREAHL